MISFYRITTLESSGKTFSMLHRRFPGHTRNSVSTTSAAPSVSSQEDISIKDPHRRICLTLYRQLLRWCDDTEPTIPLSKFIPPVHLEPPQIHPASLHLLARGDPESPLVRGGVRRTDLNEKWIHRYFPPNSFIKDTEMTVSLANSCDAKLFLRSVFRMNSYPPESGYATTDTSIEYDENTMKKEQVSLAFEGVRNLNELSTQQLRILKENRDKHWDRTGVSFRVGQVVKHDTLKWRGVIMGWNRVNEKSDAKENGTQKPVSSLTQKVYKSTDALDDIAYIVALDWGDVSIMQQNNRSISSIANIGQSNLSLVMDQDLLRIRSGQLEDHFGRFDSQTRCFVPGDVSAYVYPGDTLDEAWSTYQNPSDQAAQRMIDGIQSMAEYLRQLLLGYTSASESRNLTIMSSLSDRLTKLAHGDVITNQERLISRNLSTQMSMKHHLQQFMTIVVEVNDTLWTRRTAMVRDRAIKFNLGEIVRHKKFGFRGVVVGWDAEPAYEVTHWDGLQHIDDPEQYPFYHVIPDPSDAMLAFGGERPWRYVCEVNLETCPIDAKAIDVDLEPAWSYDISSGSYVPPDDIKFRHGGQLHDDGISERCLDEIKAVVASLLVSVRESSLLPDDSELNAISEKMSMEIFFDLLKNAEDSETATVLSDSFKEIWKANVDRDIRFLFDTGVNYLLKGKTEKALSTFGEVVDKDPGYAEAFNKASTAEYMIGNLDASLAVAHKTLDLIPNHFQALNGMGLVYNEKKDLEFAVEAFRKSLALDPWSPVAGRLSVCLDTLEVWRKTTFNMRDTATPAKDTTL